MMGYKTRKSLWVAEFGAMTDQILFDRLAYIDRLKRGGIGDDQARAHAEAMDAALRESVATRADIAGLSSAIAALDSKFQTTITALDTKIDNKFDMAVKDMTIRLGGIVALGVAALAAFKFFEH